MKKNKTLIIICLAGLLAISGFIYTGHGIQAAESGNSAILIKETVEYVKNDDLKENEQIAQVFGESAPTLDGYLFGGWYQDTKGVKTPIKTPEQKNKATGTIYAKFVPAQVLSVKAQNHAGTSNTSDQSGITSTRVISAVDSLNYKQVGFEVWVGDTFIGKQETRDVYSNLMVKNTNGSTPYTASQLFGSTASKFIVLRLENISESLWNENIYVRPYWVTFDGVEVTGLSKYVYVQDGIDRWISVPVNLHTGADIAAGMVSVTVPDGLEFKECRPGVLFDEMNVAVNGNVVNCVGNVKNLADVQANDMYITLRFKVTDSTYAVGNGRFLDFTMKQMEFCNVEEEDVPMKILDVRY